MSALIYTADDLTFDYRYHVYYKQKGYERLTVLRYDYWKKRDYWEKRYVFRPWNRPKIDSAMDIYGDTPVESTEPLQQGVLL